MGTPRRKDEEKGENGKPGRYVPSISLLYSWGSLLWGLGFRSHFAPFCLDMINSQPPWKCVYLTVDTQAAYALRGPPTM